MPPSPEPPLQFGEFTIDVGNARLLRAGQPVAVPPKAFDLLALLLRRPGELVTKDELLDQVWGRRFISEGVVKTVVSELRAALDDDVRAPRWIATVPRRGYRFIGTVAAAEAASAALRPASPPSPLVGRDEALAQLQQLLQDHALVTLTGPGGVGKTSLARAAVQSADPGDWVLGWVELAPLAAGSDVAALRAALAQALQVAPAGLGSDDALCQCLQGQACWVVLDNAEHVVDTLAPWLAGLRLRLPHLRWLVTSREPLRLAAEQQMRLAPLALPEGEDTVDDSAAVQLFARRVAARLPGFVLQPAQRDAVARLCRALDGLPLALELAAARVPVLGVHGLADQLLADGGRLALLTQGPRDAPRQQRTLRAAIDWSCELLTPAQQQAFRRLALFRGGFTLDAARRLIDEPPLPTSAALDLLEALVDKSLLVASPPAGPDDPPRFGWLETLREGAWERLDAAGETEAAQQRHLQAMLEHWRAADDQSLTQPMLPWTARHAPELENLRAALRWGLARLAAEGCGDATLGRTLAALVAHTAVFMVRAGLGVEGVGWLRQLTPRLSEPLDDPTTQALLDLARVHYSRFNRLLPPADCLPLAERAANVLQAANDIPRAYYAWYLHWTQELEQDERPGRTRGLGRMQALARDDWSPLLLRYLRSTEIYEQRLAGDSAGVLSATRTQWQACRALGARGEAWAWGQQLMMAEHDAGEVEAALASGAQLVDDIRAAGRRRTYGQLFSLVASMRAQHGDLPAARQALAEALPMLPAMPACEVLYLGLAWWCLHDQRPDDAARLLGWFESPERGGATPGPGTYQWRSARELAARLEAALGAEALARQRQAGHALGLAAAVALGPSPSP
jgi:predicted ATPase